MRVALQLDRVQVGGVLREEHLALAGAAHQLHLLAGGVADDPAADAGALVAEVDLALVEHHAALAGEHRLAADARGRPASAAGSAGSSAGRWAPPVLGEHGRAAPALGGAVREPRCGRRRAGLPGKAARAARTGPGRAAVRELRAAGRGAGGPGRGPGRRTGPHWARRRRAAVSGLAVRAAPGPGGAAGRRCRGAAMVGAACTAGAGRPAGAGGGGRRGLRGRRGRGAGAGAGGRGAARRAGGAKPGRGACGGGRCGRGLLLGDLAAEVLEQRVEAAVEALADGGEPPDVLQVEVADHHGALGGELRAVERVPDDLLAARDDPQVTGADLRHLACAVDASR